MMETVMVLVAMVLALLLSLVGRRRQENERLREDLAALEKELEAEIEIKYRLIARAETAEKRVAELEEGR